MFKARGGSTGARCISLKVAIKTLEGIADVVDILIGHIGYVYHIRLVFILLALDM